MREFRSGHGATEVARHSGEGSPLRVDDADNQPLHVARLLVDDLLIT
jgi:hypothetical protein